MIGIIIIVINK